MNTQVLDVLILHALVLVLPCILGAVLARFGDGCLLWIGAGAALVFSLIALRYFLEGHTYAGLNGLNEIFTATLLAYVGTLVAVGTCASALVRAWRNKQVAWFVALLLTAVLPLLATIVVYEYTQEVLGQFSLDLPMYDVGEQLAVELLLIGPAALLVYGLRLAASAWWSPASGPS